MQAHPRLGKAKEKPSNKQTRIEQIYRPKAKAQTSSSQESDPKHVKMPSKVREVPPQTQQVPFPKPSKFLPPANPICYSTRKQNPIGSSGNNDESHSDSLPKVSPAHAL